MAHVTHYSKASIANILREHNRECKSYKNEVDPNRTKDNYQIGFQGNHNACKKKILERCKEIMGDRDMPNNTKPMSEWVITYPHYLCYRKQRLVEKKNGKIELMDYFVPKDPQHCQRFFETAYKFLQDRYGVDNVITGYVHMDETTPHMQVPLVPESVSRKTGKRTVSVASCFTKKDLMTFHKDLGNYMVKQFNDPEAAFWVENGKTLTGESTEKLKARQRKERELKQKERKLNDREQALNERENYINDREKIIENSKKQYQAYKDRAKHHSATIIQKLQATSVRDIYANLIRKEKSNERNLSSLDEVNPQGLDFTDYELR